MCWPWSYVREYTVHITDKQVLRDKFCIPLRPLGLVDKNVCLIEFSLVPDCLDSGSLCSVISVERLYERSIFRDDFPSLWVATRKIFKVRRNSQGCIRYKHL